MRNTNDGISVVQTAEGATSEVGNILKRMRELAVQSSSETLTPPSAATSRMSSLHSPLEVDVCEVTEFNGLKLTNNRQHIAGDSGGCKQLNQRSNQHHHG